MIPTEPIHQGSRGGAEGGFSREWHDSRYDPGPGGTEDLAALVLFLLDREYHSLSAGLSRRVWLAAAAVDAFLCVEERMGVH